jgi:uncharacterized protein (DUF302 family)
VDTPFQQTVERTLARLKDHGFGVLTKIDVQATSTAVANKVRGDLKSVIQSL